MTEEVSYLLFKAYSQPMLTRQKHTNPERQEAERQEAERLWQGKPTSKIPIWLDCDTGHDVTDYLPLSMLPDTNRDSPGRICNPPIGSMQGLESPGRQYRLRQRTTKQNDVQHEGNPKGYQPGGRTCLSRCW